MMKYAVYWQHDDEIECQFFKTEQEARLHVSALIVQTEDLIDEGVQPDWDITLLKVLGEVRQIPFDGAYGLADMPSPERGSMNQMVKISVVGGVAYVEQVPPGVAVEVTDYDVDRQSAERDEAGRPCSRYSVTVPHDIQGEIAMPRYTKTCKGCGSPFSEAGICCDSGADGDGGHINGRCPKCCHGDPVVAPHATTACRRCGGELSLRDEESRLCEDCQADEEWNRLAEQETGADRCPPRE